jgi:hypothetical protein
MLWWLSFHGNTTYKNIDHIIPTLLLEKPATQYHGNTTFSTIHWVPEMKPTVLLATCTPYEDIKPSKLGSY